MTSDRFEAEANKIVSGNWTLVFVDSISGEDWKELERRIAHALEKAVQEERAYWQEFLRLNKLSHAEGRREAFAEAIELAKASSSASDLIAKLGQGG